MLEQMTGLFASWFANPCVEGIGLAVAFGVVWLAAYWPPLYKDGWLWAVLAASAFLTLAAVAFVQLPVQAWTGQALKHFWSQEVLVSWLLVAGIPAILLSGLVQEGAKLLPVVIYWWRKTWFLMDPKLGLAVGAVAGAGFGIFEAQWAHNAIFASGWTWGLVEGEGLLALAGFWERFFIVGFHTAASALAGYGLAKGRGSLFYLLASLLHALINYGVILVQSGHFSTLQLELFVATVAVLVTVVVLWLRWSKPAYA